MQLTLDRSMIGRFEAFLKADEKSRATVEKYVRDAGRFINYVGEEKPLTKETVISYKQHLAEHYKISSANSMLAAVNSFLRFLDCGSCVVKSFKVQKEVFRSRERELTKEEYIRLLEAAERKGSRRLELIMQTLCATGIRISELPFITVEALHTRRAAVSLKGKTRTVILPRELCAELKRYAREKGIGGGSIFVTRSGKPMDRSNVLHSMKALCREANVDKDKAFPHNLRHLFAVTFYKMEKDVCHLADLLGHSSINTTRIYTQISSEEQEEQICSMGLVIWKKESTA